jgi:hypothetical protein
MQRAATKAITTKMTRLFPSKDVSIQSGGAPAGQDDPRSWWEAWALATYSPMAAVCGRDGVVGNIPFVRGAAMVSRVSM